MLTEVPQTQYVILIGGAPVGTPMPSRSLAEAFLLTLSPQQRMIAEIVPQTSGGQQVLFG